MSSEAVATEARESEASTRRGSTELSMIAGMWRRDMLRLRKEPSRWFGVVLQPLMFWAIIGFGMAETFSLPIEDSVSYLEFFYPGVLVMVLLFTAIFSTISVIEDRQSGFLQGVLVAPASRVSVVLGKIAGVTSLATIQSVLFLALAPVAGFALGEIAWLGVAIVVVLTIVGLTAISLTGAWIMSTAQTYHAVMSIVLLPLWVLSGAMFPASDGVLGAIMLLNPMRYSVDGLRAALGGPAGELGMLGMWGNIGVLAGFALLSLALATRVCKRPGAQ